MSSTLTKLLERDGLSVKKLANLRKRSKTLLRSHLTFSKMKYGWSKYGGGRSGLVKHEEDWYCQSCGGYQPKEMAQYMIPLDSMLREFVRVCSICKHRQHTHKLNYRQLCYKVRIKEIYG